MVPERHVNIVAGRATFTDRTPRLFAYVHKQVPSAAARPDQFLCASGVSPDERVTVISDDAGEFGKAVEDSQLARGRILDWFHIAMKFKAAEISVFGSATIEPLEREVVKTEIDQAKWLFWHGKRGKSVAALDAAEMPSDPAFRQAVHEHVEFGSHVAMQNSHADSDAELHPLREVPKWTWSGEDS